MISVWKYHKISFLFVLLSALLYGLFAYELVRTDFLKLLALYLALFALAFQLYRTLGHKLKIVLLLGIGFRLLFILALPNLSQDFYRFIWDGYLNLNGINPYLYTPNELMAAGVPSIPHAEELYKNMGELSAANYSNYPPLNQLCFTLANLVPGTSILSSVIGLRILIILADVGIFLVGTKLLTFLKLPQANMFWFFLNPFIIIELTGNLHFEGFMLFFLVLSLYLLVKKQLLWSALCFGLSISAKLVPLMLLPLFFSYFTGGVKKGNSDWKEIRSYVPLFKYYGVTMAVVVLGFVPFLSQDLLNNYGNTIGLWFTNFEFNASIYYLLRGLGYLITGYNQIGIIGSVLPLISIGFIIYRSVFIDNSRLCKLLVSMLMVVSVYLLLSTTVHPWYIATVLVLGIFTSFKYPIVWSLMVVLSYYAYGQTNFEESYWLLAIEYAVVLWVAIKESISRRQSVAL